MRRAFKLPTAKKYILSVITLAIVASALIVGSVGSMIQVASARTDSRRNSGYSNQQRNNSYNNSNNARQSNQNTSQRTTQQTQTTNQSRQVAPTRVTPPPQQSSTSVQSSAPAVVAQPTAPPPPPDTAPAIAQMSEAQAVTATENVTYSSARISEETRNRILILAGVAAITGALLYTMSYVTVGALTGRRPIPVRYIVPVNGVMRS